MLKRILFSGAAVIATMGVIIGGAALYQKLTSQPALPQDKHCDVQQVASNQDGSLEARVYWCEGQSQNDWQGHEVWLHEPLTEQWQRILTSQHAGCLKLNLTGQRLTINHDDKRSNMHLVEPVFLFRDAEGVSQSLAVTVSTRGDAQCPALN